MSDSNSGEYVTNAIPDGAPTAWSTPATQASMPQSSTRSGQAARPRVASTSNLTLSARQRLASAWTSTTVAEAGSTDGATSNFVSGPSWSNGITRAPQQRAISAVRSTNHALPLMATRLPSSITLFRTASMPADARPETG